ncbi:CBS domain-containing protein [Candidatus Pacearchaeota archaeon]|nr:CBS domain-containing protein [Candidatus Pacearchaeota archaeon]
MKIKEIIKGDVIVIEPDLTLKEAAQIMSKNKIGSLAVIKNREILGIITERDVLKNIDSLKSKVSSVMTKKIISIDSDSYVENAATLMAKNKIKRLLVVDGGSLVGIITATDILANSNRLNDDFYFF